MRLPPCGGGFGFVVVPDVLGVGFGGGCGAMRLPLVGEIGVLAVGVGSALGGGSGRGGGAARLPTGGSAVIVGCGGARFPAGCFSQAATA
jgi:hypothetical protein